MAEIGLIASIVGVVSFGAKLSVLVFDFASTIGSAGQELRNLGTEISLLCSVLTQLEIVLRHAHFSCTTAAANTTNRILEECRSRFEELDGIVAKLKSSRDDDSDFLPSVDFVKRVKWTFQRSKVQLLRSTLNSCKITLGLMLSTMQIAENTSLKQNSDDYGIAAEGSERNDSITLQSLIISQQCSLEQLELLEIKAAQESEEDALPTLSTPTRSATATATRSSARASFRNPLLGRKRLNRTMSNLTINTTQIEPARPLPTRKDRASAWLGAMIFPESVDPHPGTLVRRRLSSVETAEVPERLLRTWTSQHANESYVSQVPSSTESHTTLEFWQDSEFSFASSHSTAPTERDRASVVTETAEIINMSPKAIRESSIAVGQNSLPPVHTAALAVPSSDLGLAVRGVPTSIQIIEDILQVFSSGMSMDEVSLRIVFGGSEKLLRGVDSPMDMITQYEDLGLSPRLVLCKGAG